MDDLTRAWREAEEHLPKGWHLDGLRCASTSLRPEDRSIAVAVNADGEERRHQASDPLDALAGLTASFRAN